MPCTACCLQACLACCAYRENIKPGQLGPLLLRKSCMTLLHYILAACLHFAVTSIIQGTVI